MKNFIALLVFISAGASWYVWHQYSQAKKQNAEFTENLVIHEQAIVMRRAEVQAYSQLNDLLKKVRDKQSEIALVQGKERLLKEKLVSLRQQRSDIINSARRSFVGQTIPELTLTDGRKLITVRVLNVEESGLSVSLPSGVQKISRAELPQDWRTRLHY
ncbi:hypothetical protein EI77_03255 [Prosthecobacter fusiformis]|uniref:Uncharacterized protein n=1 Tax=Prosthecobacter fusiformis TaxID=48464 RepID=A0A4R7RT43_9BACT|nr:hypothetical protein [Prosthecobacter fusiformis]TDU68138.1 hypothetical protein EI77_03255 [Prosthecobacter fusiformis]